MSDQKEKINKIYLVVDEATAQPLYVGWTVQTIEQRLKTHLRLARTKRRRTRLLHGLRKLNYGVCVILLEVVSSGKSWQPAEILWIKHFRDLGFDIWNMTDGGDGALNPSKEVREKMSKANKKPCTEEKRIKISKAHLKWHSDHPGARAGENNPMWKRPVSDDHRKNMQKANGGKNNGMFGKKQSGESKKKNALSQRRTWVRKALSFNNDKRPRWIKAFLKTNSILLHQLSESFKKVVLA